MSAIRVEAGTVAGIDAEELAKRFGTPLCVYDFDVVHGVALLLRPTLEEPRHLHVAFGNQDPHRSSLGRRMRNG